MKKTLPILSAVCAAAALMFSACSGGSTYTGSTSTQKSDDSKKNEDGTENPNTGGTNTTTDKTIKLSDAPTGYAGVDANSYFGKYSGWTTVTASNRADLKKYAESSTAYIILVDTMIDLSDGMMPETYDGTTSKLDSFIATNTSNSYTSYDNWRTAYAAQCTTSSDDDKSGTSNSGLYSTQNTLTTAYKAIVQVNLKSNKMIIGTKAGAGVKGGSLMINNADNIAIRNLTIQDAYDPFPHHEAGDGYNAQYDCITVQGTCNYIWIDHCLIQDTLTDHVYVTTDSTGTQTSEKWQTYDGLCDMKGDSHNITVSNCIFKNHDKTMLIGPSDSTETFSSGKGLRTITLVNNYFQNCVQRLPMVRNTKIHVVNNYYNFEKYNATKKTPNGTETEQIKSSYAIGVRYGSEVYSEANYFDTGIQYSYSGESDAKNGMIYMINDSDNSSKKRNTGKLSDSHISATVFADFDPATISGYTVDTKTADEAKTYVKENAGAGYTFVSE